MQAAFRENSTKAQNSTATRSWRCEPAAEAPGRLLRQCSNTITCVSALSQHSNQRTNTETRQQGVWLNGALSNDDNATDGGPRAEACGCCGGPTNARSRLLMATRCKVLGAELCEWDWLCEGVVICRIMVGLLLLITRLTFLRPARPRGKRSCGGRGWATVLFRDQDI